MHPEIKYSNILIYVAGAHSLHKHNTDSTVFSTMEEEIREKVENSVAVIFNMVVNNFFFLRYNSRFPKM